MTNSLGRLKFAFVLAALVPSTAFAARPAAKLDDALRQLLAKGCSGTTSVIITTESGYREGLSDSLNKHGDKVRGHFPALNAVDAEIHCEDLTSLAGFSSVKSVALNAPVAVQSVLTSVVQGTTGDAGKVQNRQQEGKAAHDLQSPFFATLPLGAKATGAGVGVAVVDSGIESGVDFKNRISQFYDFTHGDIRATAPNDGYGHGTHVAGLIASEFVGVASNARLIGLKVLDDKGQGSTANVIRAIEFAIANKTVLGIDILNLSLGHPIFEPAATDPLVQAVEHASRAGIVVVLSAGNAGQKPTTKQPGYAGIMSPGNAPSGLTVGAARTLNTVSRFDDRIAPYSSRGPSWYDGFAKPDFVAAGDNLLSVAAANSTLRRAQEARGNAGDYMRLSGTSMAAGVASGVVALMLEGNHSLTPNAVKAILEYSAIPVNDDSGKLADALTQGAGQIEAAGSVLLANAINTSAPVGQSWLSGSIAPFTVIGGQPYAWTQSIIWGDRRVAGESLLSEQRPGWALNIVWGEGLGSEDDNIVWGNRFDDDDNIVWGNMFDDGDNIVWGNNIVWGDDDNIVWGNLFDDDNIVWGNNVVWGNLFGDDDNIVWGNNIVWGQALIGLCFDDDNIVWGNSFGDDDNIVWGNLFDDDNIVWGNLFDDDNIVWGNFFDDDNIVWGNSAQLGSVLAGSAVKPARQGRRSIAKKGVN